MAGKTGRFPGARLRVVSACVVLAALGAGTADAAEDAEPPPAVCVPPSEGPRVVGDQAGLLDFLADLRLPRVQFLPYRPNVPKPFPCPEEEERVSGFENWKRFKCDLEEATGTCLGLYINAQEYALLNGPGEGRDRSVFWWNLNLTQRLWDGAKLVTNTRGGSGNGLDELLGDHLNTNWMAGEPRALYVSHCLVEQKLFDDRVTLWLGKMDPADYFDTNAVASWNFNSYGLARNPTVPCPYHAAGAVARWEPADWVYLEAGLADAEGSWTETGLNTAFRDEDYTVSLYEVGLRPTIGGRQGNYRLLLWYDDQPVARVDGTGAERGDTGFGLSFDQQLTDRLTAFFRYGYANDSLRNVAHFWSAGVETAEPIPGRPDDTFTLGVAQAMMGEQWRRANPSEPRETLFECYYTYQAAEWCAVRPNLQVLLDPGADPDSDVGVVLGVRLELSF